METLASRVESAEHQPSTSCLLAYARSGALVIWSLLMQAQTLDAAPVPPPSKTPSTLKASTPQVEADSGVRETPEAIVTWLKKHHPDCTPERIQKLIADLDDDDFDTRERAEDALIDWTKKLAPHVSPLPAFPVYGGGSYSVEQLHRLSRVRKATGNNASRLPPQKLAAKDALTLLTAHSRNVITISPADAKVIAQKLAAVGDIEIAPKKNSFYEIVGTVCDKAGLHWRLDGMDLVLCDGDGTFENAPLSVSGHYALLREKPVKEKAPGFVLVAEPAWGRVTRINEACSGPGPCSANVATSRDLGPWTNPYPQCAKLQLSLGMDLNAEKGGRITMKFNSAVSPFRCRVPLAPDMKHVIGAQTLRPVKQADGKSWSVKSPRAIWQDWNWSSSPWDADMQGWLLGAASRQTLLDADGRPIPSTVAGRSIEQRTVITTLSADQEPVAILVEGFGDLSEQTATFTVPPREKK